VKFKGKNYEAKKCWSAEAKKRGREKEKRSHHDRNPMSNLWKARVGKSEQSMRHFGTLHDACVKRMGV